MQRILILFSFLPFLSHAQLNCVVTPADTLICYRDSIAFIARVQGLAPTTFQWLKNGVPVIGANNDTLIFVRALESDTGVYSCIATRGTEVDTSNDAHLRMHPAMKFDTLYRYNPLGCRADCKGQFKALVSGGTPPYDYSWGGGYSQDTIVFGLCMGSYTLRVTDANGCMIDSSYYVDVLQSPKISFISYLNYYSEPKDIFYLSNPNVTVEFPAEYRDSVVNWEWNFGDTATLADVNPATHAYTETGMFTILLTITDQNGCDTTVAHDITIKVAELKVPNAFTPNGDGYNDQFKIEIKGEGDVDFREAYLGNEIVIFDRSGKKVYSALNYKSGDWDGRNLPDGVYYYVLKCQGQFGEDVFKGAVHILGRGF